MLLQVPKGWLIATRFWNWVNAGIGVSALKHRLVTKRDTILGGRDR